MVLNWIGKDRFNISLGYPIRSFKDGEGKLKKRDLMCFISLVREHR